MSMKKALSMPGNFPVAVADEGADYWENHIAQWIRSGLSQAAYCRGHDLDYNRFRKWKAHLSTYPSGNTSIKLVEVKRDFTLNAPSASSSPSSFVSGVNNSHDRKSFGGPGGIATGGCSGLRFWCGEFCIEVDVKFSSDTLRQLVRTLQGVYIQSDAEADAGAGSEPGAIGE